MYMGWSNYQTWHVALCFGNDRKLYRACLGEKMIQGEFDAVKAETFVRDLLPEGTTDLMGERDPYCGVNWAEVAEAFNGY